MQVVSYITIILILFLNILLPSNIAKPQSFEGEITFIKQTFKDTSFYKYKVKNNIIRIDELDENLKLKNYMIVDLNKEEIYALNPNKKLYTKLPIHPWQRNNNSKDYNIKKTQNYKIIKGYRCYQWRVKNKKENTEIAFWVTSDKFHFFYDFLKLINRIEKSSIYYLTIPETKGFFPMLSVERSLLREFKLKLSVMEIENKKMNSSLFKIPAGYRYFKRN